MSDSDEIPYGRDFAMIDMGRPVSADEFRQFIQTYQSIHRDICGISEPSFVSFYDDDGKMVASCFKQDRDESGNPVTPFLCGFVIYDGYAP
jgi:hypothetical protein